MRKRNVVLVIALLLVMPVVLVGCGSKKSEVPAVEASINGFADAYARGEYQTCTDYLVGVTDANRDSITGQLSAFHQICPTIQVDSVDNVTVNGSTATADVTVTALSKQVTIQMTLTKVDDTWKFSFGDMLTAIEKQFGF
jgi:hypothetical protein